MTRSAKAHLVSSYEIGYAQRMGKTKDYSGVAVGAAALLVVVGIIWIVTNMQTQNYLFGAVLLGLGVALGIVGAIMSRRRG